DVLAAVFAQHHLDHVPGAGKAADVGGEDPGVAGQFRSLPLKKAFVRSSMIGPPKRPQGEESTMPNPGYVRGTHHLTFCVGTAQEDYDFHVRLLGLKSVKKTVLFDGEIPIYHLYYGNRLGDASTLLTAFPYRQAGWMGKRGTNQMKTLLLSVPVDSIGFWADRLSDAGVETERAQLFGTERLNFQHPCGIY